MRTAVATSVLLLTSTTAQAVWEYGEFHGGMPVAAVERIAAGRGWVKTRNFMFPEYQLSSIFYEEAQRSVVANFCRGQLETITFYSEVEPTEVGAHLEAYRIIYGEPEVSQIPARQFYWPAAESELSLSFRAVTLRPYLVEFAATYTRPNPCLQAPKF